MADEKKIVKKPKKERKLHPLRYLKEMWGEVKKLSWLAIPDLAKHVLAVLVFVLLMSALVYGFDQVFAAGVKGLSSIGASSEDLAHDHDGDGINDHEADEHEDADLEHDHDGDGVNDHEADEHEDADLEHDHDGDGVNDHEAEDHVDAGDDSEEQEDADGEPEETPAP